MLRSPLTRLAGLMALAAGVLLIVAQHVMRPFDSDEHVATRHEGAPRAAHRHALLRARRAGRAGHGVPARPGLRWFPGQSAGALRRRQLGPAWGGREHRGAVLCEPSCRGPLLRRIADEER